MKRDNVFIGCVFFFLFFLGGTPLINANEELTISPEVKKQIETILQYEPKSGIVIGLIEGATVKFFSCGTVSYGNKWPMKKDTIFEIGSVTKVFTALLTMQMIEERGMSFDDPAQKYLSGAVTLPTYEGKDIELRHLLTHTSGLPYSLSNFHPQNQDNPYADYFVSDMYKFLSSYVLTRAIGSSYEYSNMGYGLLEHIVGLVTDKSFEELVKRMITRELGMRYTMITVPHYLQKKFTKGYSYGNEVSYWDFASLAGAGALRSTAYDLCLFIQANMGVNSSSLFSAMKKMQTVQASTTLPNVMMGFGWHIYNSHGCKIFFHTGGTGGFSSFVGFDPESKRGVVILKNHPFEVKNLGLHLINPEIPLEEIKSPIPLDLEILKKYVGTYEVNPEYILKIKLRNNRLVLNPGAIQYDFEMFPVSEIRFYTPLMDTDVEFKCDEIGQVIGLTWYIGGQIIKAKKIE